MACEGNKEELGEPYYIYNAVKREIDRWNPYGLLPEALNDEFELESEKVASRIRDGSTVDEIARTVSKVFSDAFGTQYFEVDACRNVAEKIKEALDKVRGR